MLNQSAVPRQNTRPRETARYFGLAVEVITRMPNYSFIRHGSREFVVETADLQKSLAVRRAA